MRTLSDRLDTVLDKITSDDFLTGRTLAGDIPFWVFDYPADQEEAVRAHIPFLLAQAPKKRRGMKIAYIHLLELVRDILEARNLRSKAEQMFHAKGSDVVLKNLAGPLDGTKVASALSERVDPDADMVMVAGVGSAYPVIRTHNLLNALQPLLGNRPLVVFYPGRYDGQSLSLFGDLNDKPYYRAFRLAD